MALGRGLNALIGEKQLDRVSGPVTHIPPDRIERNSYQPRDRFDPQTLTELQDSIREKGILQPLLVSRTPEGYRLIAGERRLRAALELGLDLVPVLVREVETDQDYLELALIENIQRSDLNPLEQAESYRRLCSDFGLSQEEVARKVGKDRSTVANTLRLLELEEEIAALVRNGRLNFGQARTLLGVEDPGDRLRLARRVVAEGIPVRTLEKLVADRKGRASGPRRRRATPPPDPHVAEAESRLRDALKTKVTIKPGGKQSGRIEIEYYSWNDLERIYTIIENSLKL
ncbi:MAG TPA: ParB/RepB/Spo0J family partition protein [bacterium]|nr:ParB/RepB/Spo0J family partition protein [bacterium]HPJ71299.1 ParB/RepB/Spo0J family partition protein [bacterium]HPQ65271.1 ParB/RepB/Spo0J family partition protein [bacterium]